MSLISAGPVGRVRSKSPESSDMRTLDIPQANDLDAVRAAVHAIKMGHRHHKQIAAFADFSRRHTQYRLNAARVLGLARPEGDDWELTVTGEKLLETAVNSSAERLVFANAITNSPIMQIVAGDLLGKAPPTAETLTERLCELADLSRPTARRRANGLLRWRLRVLDLEGSSVAPSAVSKPQPAPTEDQLTLF